MARNKLSLYERYVKDKPKPRSIRQTLERVREILTSKRHWIKGDEYGDIPETPDNEWPDSEMEVAGSCCLIGAIRMVDGRYERLAIDKLETMIAGMELQTELGLLLKRIPDFNDRDATTHRQILDLLDKAIGDKRK